MRFIYFMSVFALCSFPFQSSGQNPVEQICDTAPSQLQLVGFTGATFLGAKVRSRTTSRARPSFRKPECASPSKSLKP